MNFKPEKGKQLEIISDSSDQKYLVCKFEDKDGSQNLRVFILDVKSGFIGKEILRQKLFEDVEQHPDLPEADEYRESNTYVN